MKRIEVDPADVRVVGVRGRFSSEPPPPAGAGGWLRRNRLRIAGGLAAVEALLWAFHVSRIALLVLAVVAVAAHRLITPRVQSYTVHQVTWTLAFAQVLVAMGMVLLVVVSTVVAIVIFVGLVVLVLAGLAALLGDRR
jgi:hypothetical protein